eukprot:SAG11_NODE_45222_length_147_cov_24.166667_1_plen_40_part_01
MIHAGGGAAPPRPDLSALLDVLVALSVSMPMDGVDGDLRG